MSRYTVIYPTLTDEQLDTAIDAAKGEAERKAAKKLGVQDTVEVAVAALKLWGRSLTEERDRRAVSLVSPGDASRSALGVLRRRVTQELVKELEPEVRRADA